MSEITDWTDHESALWWTCRFVHDFTQSGALPPALASSFAMQMGPDEYVIQWGTYERMWFGAAGDGSYQKSWLVAGGFSPLGLGLGALTLGASAALNSSRRAAARQNATAMWRGLDAGTVYVSTHGYYLANTGSLLPFAYQAIIGAAIVRPGQVQMDVGMADDSQHRFAITSDWAELIFVMWALQHCRNHPQLQNLGWLPQEFIDRVCRAGVWQTSGIAEITPALGAQGFGSQ